MNPFQTLKDVRAWADGQAWIRPTLFFVGLAAYIVTQSFSETSQVHKVAESTLRAMIALAAGSFGSPSPVAVAKSADAAVARSMTPSPGEHP